MNGSSNFVGKRRDKRGGASTNAPTPATGVEVGFTGGCDKPYAFGLAQRAAGLFIAPNPLIRSYEELLGKGGVEQNENRLPCVCLQEPTTSEESDRNALL